MYPLLGDSRYFGNVYISGMPICDDSWDDLDAKVVCQSLGRSWGVVAKHIRHSRWGNTGDNFALDEVHCKGHERYVTECPHSKHDDCGRSEGAGVVCFEPKTVKLSQGNEGLVMALGRPVINTVWGMKESQVVCNQLFGHSFLKNVPIYQSSVVQTQRQANCVISNVKCSGSENGIERCSYDVIKDCPSNSTVPKVSCAICTEQNLIYAIQSLTVDGNRKEQYEEVEKQLSYLKTKCRNWDCSGKEKNFTNPDFCKVMAFLEDWKAILEPANNTQVVFPENKFHYSKLLEQNLLKQRFSSLDKSIRNLGDQTSVFQKSLANHFKTLSRFDADKTKTDLRSLTASWKASINGIKDEKSLLKKQLSDLINLTSDVLVADKFALLAKMILQIVQTIVSGPTELAGNAAGTFSISLYVISFYSATKTNIIQLNIP